MSQNSEPKWMRIARGEIGTHERPGGADNPRVLDYYREIGHGWVQHDEVAWCAAFVGACLVRAGQASTRSLQARSYLKWGKSLARPKPGCVVILSRGRNPILGHVGFFVRETKSRIFLLGGNQSNAVNVTGYAKGRVLGYRWPAKPPLTGSESAPGSTVGASKPDIATNDGFSAALDHVLALEGGWANDPHDPGGPTNKGITLATYAAYRGVAITSETHDSLIRDLRSISPQVTREIYYRRFWRGGHCNDLPPPLAFMHFDAGVNHGVNGAARMLQRAVGAEVDGEIGPETIGAARRSSQKQSVRKYAEVRRTHYRRLKHFWRFGRGWLRRVDLTERRAIALALATPDPSAKPRKERTEMTQETKWWGNSMTIWGTIITALSTVAPVIAPLFGLEISADAVKEIGENLLRLIQSIGGLVGVMITVFGRVRATSQLTSRRISLTI